MYTIASTNQYLHAFGRTEVKTSKVVAGNPEEHMRPTEQREQVNVRSGDQNDGDRTQQHIRFHSAPAASRPRSVHEVADRGDVPVLGEGAEQFLEPEGHPNVRERIAAQAHERVVVGDSPAVQDIGVESLHIGARHHRVGTDFATAGNLGDGSDVRLPGRCPGKLVDDAHANRRDGKATGLGGPSPHIFHITAVFDDRDEFVDATGAAGGQPALSECRIDVLKIDTQAEHFRESASAADHLVQPFIGALGEVAGPQFARQSVPEREVLGGLCIPQHDVRPRIYELASPVRGVGQGLESEGSAGNRPPDGVRMGGGEIWWQVGHPGCGLGLPVHDEQVPTAASAEFGVASNALWGQPTAGLSDVAQVGQIQLIEPDAVEQIEGVRHSREGGDALGPDDIPEFRIGNRGVGEHQCGAAQQVAVYDGQPIAVVHGQRRDSAIGVADREIVRDRFGVGLHIAVREAHELR